MLTSSYRPNHGTPLLQLWCHLISLRLWITCQLAHTHTHVSTSFIWHSQGESFQDNWCLRTEEPLFNISAVLLESFETIIYYYFLAYFLKQRASNTDLFPSLVCWEVLCGSYCRLSSTCVETHLALYLGLLEDMFQVLVCQAWFIQSELVSPKKKKVPESLQSLVWRLPCTSLTLAPWDPRDSLLGRDWWSVLTVVGLAFVGFRVWRISGIDGTCRSPLKLGFEEHWLDAQHGHNSSCYHPGLLLSSALSCFITFVQQPVPRPF